MIVEFETGENKILVSKFPNNIQVFKENLRNPPPCYKQSIKSVIFYLKNIYITKCK